MKTYLDCYPCFLRQALEAARMAGADEQLQKEVLDRVLGLLAETAPALTPPEIGDRIHRLVRREVGHADPYRRAKDSSTRQALSLHPRLQALLANADDPLDVAVRLSIAGNIIDLAMNRQFDLWNEVERVLVQPFAVDDGQAFRDSLARSSPPPG